MKKKDLAFALGLSAPMVSKLCAAGMPTGSLEAALAWRRRNIDPARAKGVRFDSAKGTPMSVITAQRMGELAFQDFSTWVDDLQAALRAVPVHQRAKVSLPAPLFHRLTTDAKAIIDETAEADGKTETASIDDSDVEVMGAFWYSIAAGEFVVHEGTIVAIAQPAKELLAAF